MCFFDLSFWKDLLSNGIATLLGALIGIPIALALDRRVWRARAQEESRRKRLSILGRQLKILGLIEATLDKNKALLLQMEDELATDRVIFYNVDTKLLEATSSLKYEIIKDLELNGLLDSIRYELGHLHRKVELQLDMEFSTLKAMSSYQAMRSTLVESIHAHLPRIKKEIDEALQRVEAREIDLAQQRTQIKSQTR